VITSSPSFLLSTFPYVRSVNWLVAANGYRTFRVGRHQFFDKVSRLYCPEWMLNERAEKQLSLCLNLPPIFTSEEWEWRQLEDPPQTAFVRLR